MSLDLLFGSPQVWPPAIPAIGYTQPPISPGRVFNPLMPPSPLQPPYNVGLQAATWSSTSSRTASTNGSPSRGRRRTAPARWSRLLSPVR